MKKEKNRRKTMKMKSENKKLRLLLSLSFIWILTAGNTIVMAQVSQPALRTITGKVIAADDEQPIPGANIVIKGTQKGTTTDADGTFSLLASDGDILQIYAVDFN